MSGKSIALGFTVGLGIGASVAFIFATRPGEEVRQELRKKINECIFRLRWQVMSPEDRYVYFWHRERRQAQKAYEASSAAVAAAAKKRS
jgi:hypothetical protein